MRIVIALFLLCISHYISAQDTLLWQFKAESGIYSSPVVEDYIYFGDNASNLYALSKQTGKPIWTARVKGAIKSKPCVYNELIIINDASGSIQAFDRLSGSEIWTFTMDDEKTVDMWDYYLSSPVVHKGIVYIGSGDQHVYALNAENGELVWKYRTVGVVHASAVIYDEKVLIGSFDGYFYALDGDTGQLVWKFKTVGDKYFPNGAIQKAACVYKDKVIFGSRDFNVYALDVTSGRGHWNYKERGSWVIATPLLIDDNLYFGTSDTHRFYCFNADDGAVQWQKELNMRVYGTAADCNGIVYFGCFNGKLYGMSAQSGDVVFEFQTAESHQRYAQLFKSETEFADGVELYGADSKEVEQQILGLGAFLSSPVIENDILYIGDANGNFYAISVKQD
ncbi:PQQ-binding-like beta-propeller repeat protein [Carboxylicivirga mesophila]|uniref:PQQ-binding-like beta-propeller repeat protein n=1 Tax=Carboxylicivirga mesophila TaxID=1166478 RepID=A0ABS5KFX5_9BACT|nr:PQQ-binding-like beta-propeller repeat protein [Carboxylicivirga mesophila]MBS2213228.1 PQQ-binding-like beta-propeller repeat protein [Carboxylicivirga mesophila]